MNLLTFGEWQQNTTIYFAWIYYFISYNMHRYSWNLYSSRTEKYSREYRYCHYSTR